MQIKEIFIKMVQDISEFILDSTVIQYSKQVLLKGYRKLDALFQKSLLILI